MNHIHNIHVHVVFLPSLTMTLSFLLFLCLQFSTPYQTPTSISPNDSVLKQQEDNLPSSAPDNDKDDLHTVSFMREIN